MTSTAVALGVPTASDGLLLVDSVCNNDGTHETSIENGPSSKHYLAPASSLVHLTLVISAASSPGVKVDEMDIEQQLSELEISKLATAVCVSVSGVFWGGWSAVVGAVCGDELQAGRSSQAVIGRVRGPFLKADLFEWYKDEDRRWWITWENGLKEFFGGQEVRDPYRSTACVSKTGKNWPAVFSDGGKLNEWLLSQLADSAYRWVTTDPELQPPQAPILHPSLSTLAASE
ncbi:hypothetical protein SCLCIDRAFT_1143622 [Scleroderma citrinum Foug A]|uniref:Uncharacterized protein n=1 Tax=Scleroderma citrinum Foug A TaxID=1036808 RepID=A0A0C2ZXK5_9AGAM|nr:hypothetical protein SCLCIDRAFT_1143622 [Scleroderma citrinum Foug A]